MVTIVKGASQAPAGSLEDLARQADELGQEPSAPPTAEELAQEAEAAKAVSAMEQGAAMLLFKGLQAVRSRVSKSLPEILNHWTDEVMRAPADAAIPVLKKRLAALLPMLGDYPEEAALVMSAVPMLMGYAAALTEHESKVDAAVGNALAAASDQVRAAEAGNVVQLVPVDGG
jgi:hypothetical protein